MTAQETQNGAASFFSIQDKLAAIIYLLNTGNMTAQQIQTAARCYQCIEDKMGAIIYLLANGAGGGGTGGVYLANYGGIAPNVTPVGNAVAFDSSTGKIWGFDGSTWAIYVA